MNTNNDLLLDELKQDVERDRWMSLWKRHQNTVLGVIAAIILGTAAQSWWKHAEAEKNMAMTDALYAAAGDSKTAPEKAAADLLAFADQNQGTNASFMAQIQAAGVLLKADKKTDAMLQLEAAIANKDADPDMHALAVLKYVQIGFDRLDAAQVTELLQPLQSADSAFRFQAWELGALNAYRAGDQETVKDMLAKLLADKETPTGQKTRAADLQRVLVK